MNDEMSVTRHGNGVSIVGVPAESVFSSLMACLLRAAVM